MKGVYKDNNAFNTRWRAMAWYKDGRRAELYYGASQEEAERARRIWEAENPEEMLKSGCGHQKKNTELFQSKIFVNWSASLPSWEQKKEPKSFIKLGRTTVTRIYHPVKDKWVMTVNGVEV